jgi:hypothetical protein
MDHSLATSSGLSVESLDIRLKERDGDFWLPGSTDLDV